jgi:hypothetical protein
LRSVFSIEGNVVRIFKLILRPTLEFVSTAALRFLEHLDREHIGLQACMKRALMGRINFNPSRVRNVKATIIGLPLGPLPIASRVNPCLASLRDTDHASSPLSGRA